MAMMPSFSSERHRSSDWTKGMGMPAVTLLHRDRSSRNPPVNCPSSGKLPRTPSLTAISGSDGEAADSGLAVDVRPVSEAHQLSDKDARS